MHEPAHDPRLDALLSREPVLWLSTVQPSGMPHVVPIWFSWNGRKILLFSKPDAVKVRNIRRDPRVMVAVGDAEADFDVGLVEGRADLLDRPTAAVVPAGHFAKYADRMAGIGLSADEYAATYSQPIAIRPTRLLDWRGRTGRASVESSTVPLALP